jgi:hypothetical protein
LYPDDFEIKEYNYLILDNSTNQIDSLTDINYDVEIILFLRNSSLTSISTLLSGHEKFMHFLQLNRRIDVKNNATEKIYPISNIQFVANEMKIIG